jgi:Concanavalin A-like lectin/glucanases superfamily
MGGIDRYTKLLLHCDGAASSTVFPDATGLHTVTATGNAHVGTSLPKFGTGRLDVNATASTLLTLDGSADFAFGTGDFTIDLWITFGAIGGNPSIFYDGRGSGETTRVTASLYTSTDSKLHLYMGTADVIVGTTVLTINTFYHVAVARASGTSRLFLNGNLEGSATDSNNYTIGASRPTIGGDGNNPTAGTTSLSGAMDEIRVSKSISRWTANFTPPATAYSRSGRWWF